jgi:pimeloyl-ACP methyl ester carboxylesterase
MPSVIYARFEFRYNTAMPSKSQHWFFREPYPFEMFLPEGPGPFPVIFQTPILGRFSLFEDLFFERRFCHFFAKQGFASILIHRPIFEYDPLRGLEQIQAYLESSLERNQKVFEAITKNPNLDLKRAGCFGMSFGAIISLLWATRNPQLAVNVLALAGGNLTEIFMTSRDPLMKSYREAALRACGKTPEVLRDRLRKLFILDPLDHIAQIQGDKTLLILALFDCVVPYRYGRQLHEKNPSLQVLKLPLGHYFSLLSVPVLKWKVAEFFRKNF